MALGSVLKVTLQSADLAISTSAGKKRQITIEKISERKRIEEEEKIERRKIDLANPINRTIFKKVEDDPDNKDDKSPKEKGVDPKDIPF